MSKLFTRNMIRDSLVVISFLLTVIGNKSPSPAKSSFLDLLFVSMCQHKSQYFPFSSLETRALIAPHAPYLVFAPRHPTTLTLGSCWDYHPGPPSLSGLLDFGPLDRCPPFCIQSNQSCFGPRTLKQVCPYSGYHRLSKDPCMWS